jgi:hypothetical protein
VAKGLIDRALRLGEGRQFKEYERRVASINRIEPEMELLADDEIRTEADGLRERARNGESLDDLLPEAFALCREAARRALGQRHFDVCQSQADGDGVRERWVRRLVPDGIRHGRLRTDGPGIGEQGHHRGGEGPELGQCARA